MAVVTKMAGALALLLFGLAVTSALPQPEKSINWPDRPDWWPDSLSWPPALSDLPENEPSWWPGQNWPPSLPENAPQWWPASLPWPPAIPEQWPEEPSWWPDSLPWPPAHPESIPWPPTHPDIIPWPPALPEQWPDQPSWWPDLLPWPPALPEQWPDQPSWWPDLLPWPPALPEGGLPDITWPPPGVNPDNIPYIPSRDNGYHLFTRRNPYVSQPLVLDNDDLLRASNYDASLSTVVLVHDIRASVTAGSNAILAPAILAARDANVIMVDWSAGAHHGNLLSTLFSVASGNHVARFIRWLTYSASANLADFHLIGVGLGGHNVGFIGLRLNREVGYITALDPSRGPEYTGYLPALSPNVAKYSEVIHTDAGAGGYEQPLGDVDFYPNGGRYMHGCGGDSTCNRNRAVYYFAESIQTGGFTGVQCTNWRDAFTGSCSGPERLALGGLDAKIGARGTYYVPTNAMPPFSQG